MPVLLAILSSILTRVLAGRPTPPLHSPDMRRADVTAYLDELFPPSLAEDWDHSGLQVGPLSAPCRRVVVTLDFDVSLASGLGGVDLVIVHHPLLFHPPERIDPAAPLGEKLRALLSSGTACYAVHTPYDVARGGQGEYLAGLLGLEGVRPLSPRGELVKLAVFVPEGHVDKVAQALFSAGAGKIGRYGHCSFRTPGTGTFLPEEGTQPFIGEPGREERVAEVRLETIVPRERLPKVIAAMRAAHPYEEVAFDLYPLLNRGELHGLGRIGELPAPAPVREVVERFSQTLGRDGAVQLYGPLDCEVVRVAICGGSGGSLWREALAAGAELYLTGEIGYHEGLEAGEAGLAVAALGHRETEYPFVAHVAALLAEEFPGLEVIRR